MRKASESLQNQSGFLTVQFIFGFFIAFGIITLLLRLSYTFTVVEVTQYIMFSTSRAYSAAASSEDAQYEAAQAKYESLAIKNPVLKASYGTGWFVVPKEATIGHFSQNASIRPVSPDYVEDTRFGGVAPFTGARIDFQAPVLTVKVPFIGTTNSSGTPFTAGIASFLIREPSLKECQDFMAARSNFIRSMSGFSSLQNVSMKNYVPMEDNGC